MAGLPRVTEIIQAAGLMSTAWFNDHVRDLGTAVHAACHYYDEGDLDEASVDPEVAPYLEQYKRYLSETGAVVHEAEIEVVHNTLQYVGHLDRILSFNDTTFIVDIKTGGPAEWHGVQTEAYRQALTANRYVRAGLYLSPTGYKFKEHLRIEDWGDFKAALHVFRRRQEWNLL